MSISTTDLPTLVATAPESAIEIEGGERFIQLPKEYAVQTADLKGLKGVNFYDPYEEIFIFHKADAVHGEIYENVDGLFLALRVKATFLYGEHKNKIKEEFTIWIAEEDGGEIEAGDFSNGSPSSYFEPEAIQPILSRFSL